MPVKTPAAQAQAAAVRQRIGVKGPAKQPKKAAPRNPKGMVRRLPGLDALRQSNKPLPTPARPIPKPAQPQAPQPAVPQPVQAPTMGIPTPVQAPVQAQPAPQIFRAEPVMQMPQPVQYPGDAQGSFAAQLEALRRLISPAAPVTPPPLAY
jgi:hypothetical protein